ncbi:hypothetical protein BZL30_4817 [Mycobacterium kansasii]|uniref:Uncharacterized protein n=1 Tax=Mycobacterium kansasii TaxID=1768 RepID=A0A1V3X481_MYCKA|nr:hypothetical protein BZL30_4817 [Mycobacterium kansasii]
MRRYEFHMDSVARSDCGIKRFHPPDAADRRLTVRLRRALAGTPLDR